MVFDFDNTQYIHTYIHVHTIGIHITRSLNIIVQYIINNITELLGYHNNNTGRIHTKLTIH